MSQAVVRVKGVFALGFNQDEGVYEIETKSSQGDLRKFKVSGFLDAAVANEEGLFDVTFLEGEKE